MVVKMAVLGREAPHGAVAPRALVLWECRGSFVGICELKEIHRWQILRNSLKYRF